MRRKKILMLTITAIMGVATVNTTMAFSTSRDSSILKEASDLNPKVLALAEKAFYCANKRGVVNKPVLTIIDYSKPSTQKRLWVIDMAKAKVKFHELVAHGQGSGENTPNKFSDSENSHQSSLGVFVTKQPYIGHNGLSLRMDGLEPGVNNHALERNVVFHGADYVNDAFAESQGRLGRSWGCPALPRDQAQETIHAIQGGSLVFAYYPDRKWLKQSAFLSCG